MARPRRALLHRLEPGLASAALSACRRDARPAPCPGAVSRRDASSVPPPPRRGAAAAAAAAGDSAAARTTGSTGPLRTLRRSSWVRPRARRGRPPPAPDAGGTRAATAAAAAVAILRAAAAAALLPRRARCRLRERRTPSAAPHDSATWRFGRRPSEAAEKPAAERFRVAGGVTAIRRRRGVARVVPSSLFADDRSEERRCQGSARPRAAAGGRRAATTGSSIDYWTTPWAGARVRPAADDADDAADEIPSPMRPPTF